MTGFLDRHENLYNISFKSTNFSKGAFRIFFSKFVSIECADIVIYCRSGPKFESLQAEVYFSFVEEHY